MEVIKTMAASLAAEIRGYMPHNKFVEARLQVTHELNEDSHEAILWLYCEEDDQPSDNIFRGDASDAEFDIATSTYRGVNKQFIMALEQELALDWCYMSEQVHLPFDRIGYRDVTARFPYDNLMDALSTLELVPLGGSTKPQSPSGSLEERIEELRAGLQAHYDSLHDGDDTTIYFVCDIDEDKTSAENEDYVYTGHRVIDSDYETIARLDEDVFDDSCDGDFVGDIESQMYKTDLELWLEIAV